MEYIRAHCCDNCFDYSIPSSLYGMSYSYFKRLFVEKFGMPPSNYISVMRLEHAAELPATGRYTVTETASVCGFDNVYYFSAAFKKHFGIPPNTFKNQPRS